MMKSLQTSERIPSRAEALNFAASALEQLNPDARSIRAHLSALVERAVMGAAREENTDVLKAAAYLQEVGVIHSSMAKAGYSEQMVRRYFEDEGETLDHRLIDCIRHHDLGGNPRTQEGRLMHICHRYASTHYLDYMLFKHAWGAEKFERLQLRRIEDYTRRLRQHPRGNEIEIVLQGLFLG